MSKDQAPTQQRYMRACMVCSVVQPQQRFRDQGCPNCEVYLGLAGNNDAIEAFTSQVFEGLITLAAPERSWVAKWQRLSTYKPGMYAIKVSGQLSDEARLQWEENSGMEYIPRDGSATDADWYAESTVQLR